MNDAMEQNKKNLPKILSPAGSLDALKAAVIGGADGVYFGAPNFNARKFAKNFSEEEFREGIHFCKLRGVETHITLNTIISDREIPEYLDTLKMAVSFGADSIIVQDLGALSLIKKHVPDIHVSFSTQCGIQNLEGCEMAAKLGVDTAVLARELSFQEIEHIAKNSPIKTEVFIHGALCASYSGRCYMSAVIGRRSGNRGRCAQPCRLPYVVPGEKNSCPMSLKDLWAVDYIPSFISAGINYLKIEGRMKRPEYVMAVTAIYKKLVLENRVANEEERILLTKVFSRSGFTNGYLSGFRGKEMKGVRTEDDKISEEELANIATSLIKDLPPREQSLRGEYKIIKGEEARFSIPAQKITVISDKLPEEARNHALTKEEVENNLKKTGASAFVFSDLSGELSENTSFPLSKINELRRESLKNLEEKILSEGKKEFLEQEEKVCYREFPFSEQKLAVSVERIESLNEEMAFPKVSRVYLPLREILRAPERVRDHQKHLINIEAYFPYAAEKNEIESIRKSLPILKELSIDTVLCGNLGYFGFLQSEGFKIRGDFDLNLYNSKSISEIARLCASSATLSFELSFPQMRDLRKEIETEMIAYGRLPLMLLYAPLAPGKDRFYFSDRKQESFLAVNREKGRTEIFNGKKLYLADKLSLLMETKVPILRLSFTDETPDEIKNIIKEYKEGSFCTPQEFTRGLYFRGVD